MRTVASLTLAASCLLAALFAPPITSTATAKPSDYFAHESRDGGPFAERVRRYANHRALGETLAMLGGCGSKAARRVVRMWMNSPGHRAILLSSSFKRVGLGRRVGDLRGDRACVVTADFGSRK